MPLPLVSMRVVAKAIILRELIGLPLASTSLGISRSGSVLSVLHAGFLLLLILPPTMEDELVTRLGTGLKILGAITQMSVWFGLALSPVAKIGVPAVEKPLALVVKA